MAPVTWVVVVAGGTGARFGAAKQYAPVGGRRLVDWSLEAARTAAADGGVVLVVPPDRVADGEPLADVVVAGGPTRSASVRAGLAAVPDEVAVIVVHDAARPAASPALFRAVVDAVTGGADGAVPGVPLVDTVKLVGPGGVVRETLDRGSLVAVQTPQAFAAAVLRRAHASGVEATDDAALVEAAGGRVVVVAGEAANAKVTHAGDLALVEAALVGRR